MKYILDFDSTLFNTVKCYEKIDTEGVGGLEFIPEVWQEYDSRDFLYEDVLPWMNSKKKENLSILTAVTPSHGPQAWEYQKTKLSSGKFEELVSQVVFMEGLKGESVAEIAKQFPSNELVVFIDDRIEQCLSIKAVCPNVICCLMVRNPEIIGEVDEVKDIKVVHSLADVDVIIGAI